MPETYNLKVLEAIEAFKAEGIPFAGIIFCSTFSSSGLLTMPDNYLKTVAETVRKAGGLYISDEV